MSYWRCGWGSFVHSCYARKSPTHTFRIGVEKLGQIQPLARKAMTSTFCVSAVTSTFCVSLILHYQSKFACLSSAPEIACSFVSCVILCILKSWLLAPSLSDRDRLLPHRWYKLILALDLLQVSFNKHFVAPILTSELYCERDWVNSILFLRFEFDWRQSWVVDSWLTVRCMGVVVPSLVPRPFEERKGLGTRLGNSMFRT